jgi:hypothetical protein
LSLAKDGMGVTPAERERLAGAPQGATEMDFKTSAIVFASLLLIVALIVAASLIARLEAGRETSGSVVAENQVENQEQTDDSTKTLGPVPRAEPLPTGEAQPLPIKE